MAGKANKPKREGRIQRFIRETMGELRKVSWPTWPEARNLTMIVIVVLIIMAIFLWLFDTLTTRILSLIVGV